MVLLVHTLSIMDHRVLNKRYDNHYEFNQNTNLANGFHYSIVVEILLYGETSRSNNGGIAHLHGLMASLHPRLEF